jgi:hypothetical protein
MGSSREEAVVVGEEEEPLQQDSREKSPRHLLQPPR